MYNKLDRFTPTSLIRSNCLTTEKSHFQTLVKKMSIFSQFHILQLLLECPKWSEQSKKTILNLASTCKKYAKSRLMFLLLVCKLTFYDKKNYCKALNMGALRVELLGKWVKRYNFDFRGAERKLVSFECPHFDQPIKSFGNLAKFHCRHYNQQPPRFKRLKEFDAYFFNRKIRNFGSLEKFSSFRFNRKLTSFNNLDDFMCPRFNRKVVSFEELTQFYSSHFNQPINGFDKLESFTASRFNQLCKDFGKLESFECSRFNQPIESFGNLRYFDCRDFDQEVSHFGKLQIFQGSQRLICQFRERTTVKE